MVWGAFTACGTLKLAYTSSHMDSIEYQTVLSNHLLPFLRGRRRQSFTFMQDNAKVHISRSTMSWFQTHHVNVLDWPSCSPDLNPIENIWGVLVRRIYADNKVYDSTAALKDALEEAWSNLQPSLLQTLVDSLPSRIFETIAKQGGPTKY